MTNPVFYCPGCGEKAPRDGWCQHCDRAGPDVPLGYFQTALAAFNAASMDQEDKADWAYAMFSAAKDIKPLPEEVLVALTPENALFAAKFNTPLIDAVFDHAEGEQRRGKIHPTEWAFRYAGTPTPDDAEEIAANMEKTAMFIARYAKGEEADGWLDNLLDDALELKSAATRCRAELEEE